MDVRELFDLASWYVSYYKGVNSRYNDLFERLSHNANQSQQEPLTEQLKELASFLSSMNIAHLSIQQIELLEQLEVWEWLGEGGARRIEETVKTSSYDPATTRDRVDEVRRRIQQTHEYFTSYISATKNLGVGPETHEPTGKEVIVRIGFKNDASIRTVSDLKRSSEDWNHIVRGLALAANENPDDVRVVGASNGSIWLILSVPLAITKYLAIISKNVASIANDVLGVRIKAEELKQAGITTKIMEAELEKIEKHKHDDGIKAIRAELAKLISSEADGGIQNALDKSIDKLVDFGQRGGDVDFVAPPEDAGVDDEGQEENEELRDLLGEIDEVRDLIYEYQQQREQVRLIESDLGSGRND